MSHLADVEPRDKSTLALREDPCGAGGRWRCNRQRKDHRPLEEGPPQSPAPPAMLRLLAGLADRIVTLADASPFHDHYVAALRAAGNSDQAFVVPRNRIRIQLRLTAAGSAFAPELATVAHHLRIAIGFLAERQRVGKGIELALEAIAFLHNQRAARPNDTNLLEGLATVCDEAAKLAKAAQDLAGASKFRRWPSSRVSVSLQ